MARTTPQVANNLLADPGLEPIVVGSPAWFAWLEQAAIFSFRDPAGTFTARREARERGDGYWRAYRTVDGRQRRAYLGRSADLTPERLRAVAAQLGADRPASSAGASAHGAAAPVAADSATLLSTKLYMPRPRSAIVQRPRLLARLDAGLPGPLTLIAAPAGFGKTTLLADWLASRSYELRVMSSELSERDQTQNSKLITHNSQVAWLSLDASDNDAAIFLRYLVAALRRGISAAAGTMALALLEAPQPPPLATLLTTLVNDLAALPPSERGARPYILVLDDYHVITALAVHSALAFLIEHLPPTLHLVIASREDPPLPLARLRARAEISELRAADLRFTPAEAAAFLRDVMGLDMTAGEAAALEERTEGWIAGLQLAALSMRDRADRAGFIAAFSGSNRFVVDYLASEVLDRLPDHLRTFMLQTAILDRMCAPLCDAVVGVMGDEWRVTGERAATPDTRHSSPVTGQIDSQVVLEELEHANLFVIPLDDQRRWYRYHHLFAATLRERLQRSLPAAGVARLHRRACAWLERHGLLPEAIQHALSANDFETAARLIERVALPMALDGQHMTVGSWLAELPAAERDARPRLVLAQAYITGSNGDYAAAETLLRQAEASEESWGEAEAAALRGEVAALRALALSMLGDERAADLGRMALAQLPERHPLRGVIVSGLCFTYFSAGDLSQAGQVLQEALAAHRQDLPLALRAALLALLAMVRRAQGRLREVRRLSEQVLELTTSDGRTLPLAGAMLAYLLLGLTRCEQNDLDGAQRTLQQCGDLARQYDMANYEVLAQFYQGQALAARGDLAGALGMVEQAAAAAGRYLSPHNLHELEGYQVILWLRQGDVGRAAAWAARRELAGARPRFTSYDYDRFALAQTLMAQGQWGAAAAAVAKLLSDAEATGHGRYVIWALVLQALIRHAQGDIDAALASLGRALALAEPEGYVRVFADEGAPMTALLREAFARGIAPDYVVRLLAAFPDELKIENVKLRKSATQTAQPLSQFSILNSQFEALSERELEVLRLLAGGQDNAAIARALVLSIGTVKSHVNHIFGKLGVRNRLEAVLRAQELNLL